MNSNETLPAQTHDLKTWPQYFSAVDAGAKPFEIRKNDRGFRVGDTLRLREFDPQRQAYTGRETTRSVSYVTDFAQQPGFVVLGLGTPHVANAPAVTGEDEDEVKAKQLSPADHAATLRDLRECAAAWVPVARLLGNVRAGDIVAAIDAMLATPPAAPTAVTDSMIAAALDVLSAKGWTPPNAATFGGDVAAAITAAIAAGSKT